MLGSTRGSLLSGSGYATRARDECECGDIRAVRAGGTGMIPHDYASLSFLCCKHVPDARRAATALHPFYDDRISEKKCSVKRLLATHRSPVYPCHGFLCETHREFWSQRCRQKALACCAPRYGTQMLKCVHFFRLPNECGEWRTGAMHAPPPRVLCRKRAD